MAAAASQSTDLGVMDSGPHLEGSVAVDKGVAVAAATVLGWEAGKAETEVTAATVV